MTSQEAPFPLSQGKGAAAIRVPVVAGLCRDMGCEIACTKCGHVFVLSKPLSDESVEVDNLDLARNLWFHRCSDEGQRWRKQGRYGR